MCGSTCTRIKSTLFLRINLHHVPLCVTTIRNHACVPLMDTCQAASPWCFLWLEKAHLHISSIQVGAFFRFDVISIIHVSGWRTSFIIITINMSFALPTYVVKFSSKSKMRKCHVDETLILMAKTTACQTLPWSLKIHIHFQGIP